MRAGVIRPNEEASLKDDAGLMDKASLMDGVSLMDEASFSSSFFFFFFKTKVIFILISCPPHSYLCLCDKAGKFLKLCLPHFLCACVYCGLVRRLTT